MKRVINNRVPDSLQELALSPSFYTRQAADHRATFPRNAAEYVNAKKAAKNHAAAKQARNARRANRSK